MTKPDAARIKALADDMSKKRLDVHIAQNLCDQATKRFENFLEQIVEKDDPAARPVAEDVSLQSGPTLIKSVG
jgi:hypothetical protein